MVRKFKKGTVVLGYDSKEELERADIQSFYDGDMFWNDLYIHYVSEDDAYYVIDANKALIYSLEWARRFNPNILDALHGAIVHERNRYRLYPITDKDEYNRVMEDWRSE